MAGQSLRPLSPVPPSPPRESSRKPEPPGLDRRPFTNRLLRWVDDFISLNRGLLSFLLNGGGLDCAKISPGIFGTTISVVADEESAVPPWGNVTTAG